MKEIFEKRGGTKPPAERGGKNSMKTHPHELAVLLLLGGLFARYSFLAFAQALLKFTTAAGRLGAHELAFPEHHKS